MKSITFAIQVTLIAGFALVTRRFVINDAIL